jgi:predicted 3-demethylubiquinone-9 3-methyltransferase (glyoxalase superfamily)
MGNSTYIDSPVKHNFSFTPAFSLFVECESEGEIGRVHSELSAAGSVFMPLGDHGFRRKFARVNDRYGVSRQWNLASSKLTRYLESQNEPTTDDGSIVSRAEAMKGL